VAREASIRFPFAKKKEREETLLLKVYSTKLGRVSSNGHGGIAYPAGPVQFRETGLDCTAEKKKFNVADGRTVHAYMTMPLKPSRAGGKGGQGRFRRQPTAPPDGTGRARDWARPGTAYFEKDLANLSGRCTASQAPKGHSRPPKDVWQIAGERGLTHQSNAARATGHKLGGQVSVV